MFSEEHKNKCNKISEIIIGCAIEVHKILGPGLLESSYEACLCFELAQKKIDIVRQMTLPVNYKGNHIDTGYRIDIMVDDKVIVELKAIDSISQVHKSQLISYLKLSNKWLGLLINFNVRVLKNGIVRIVNG
jgi:GxxExxY protein